MTAILQPIQFTRKQYYELNRLGFIDAAERVELINGQIITMSPINSPHSGTVNVLNDYLRDIIDRKVILSVQNPIILDDLSEPEPDVVVAKYRKDRYTNHHPRPTDIEIVIEVSDATLSKDRRVKKPLYAKAGIREYWIVNIIDRQIEVFRKPAGSTYKEAHIYTKGETFAGSDDFNYTAAVDEIFIRAMKP